MGEAEMMMTMIDDDDDEVDRCTYTIKESGIRVNTLHHSW